MNAPSEKPVSVRPPSQKEGDSAALLEAMRLLSADPQLSQRQLSQALGLSLGKTHYMLHALLEKGWVKVHNFRRSDNKMAYSYLLTPTGIREKLEMTRAFLIHKEAEFENLQATIAQLRSEVQGSQAPGSKR